MKIRSNGTNLTKKNFLLSNVKRAAKFRKSSKFILESFGIDDIILKNIG